MNRLVFMGLCLGLSGCEKTAPPAPSTTSAAEIPAVAPIEAIDKITPPPERLALPLQVVGLRLPEGSVGEMETVDFSEPGPVPLRAIGVNLCQTGWFIQGYIEREGKLLTTPGFLLEFAELKSEGFRYDVPGVTGSHLFVELKKLSLTEAVGKISVIDENQKTTFSMTFDGPPVGTPAQPGFSAQGCFTTGFYLLPDGVQGPATAVYDGKDLYYVGLRLSEQHSLVFMLSLRNDLRTPGNVIQGSLKRVADDLKKFPFRVLLETRSNSTTKNNGPMLETKQIPVEDGLVRASFLTNDAKGPLRIEFTDLVIPEWDGPFSGQTLKRVQAEVLFVTDPASPVIPVPSAPKWITQPKP